MKSITETVKAFVGAGLALAIIFTLEGKASAQKICVPPPAGLISWWTGDGDADDLVGGNDGTLKNGAAFDTGVVGHAFGFDGNDDYIQITESPNLQLGTSDFTIDFWARILSPTTKTQTFMTTQAVHTDPPGILISNRPDVGGILFDVRDDVSMRTIKVPLQLDEDFHHFGFVRRQGVLEGYVDGAEVSTVLNEIGDVPNMSSPAPLLFGRTGLSSLLSFFYAGAMDEIEIYNRALTSQEIQLIFNAGSAGKCTAEIDIKPGSFPNSINPRSSGVIPVAILTTNVLDATTVGTVLFGATGTEASPVRTALEDVDLDGDIDLLLYVNTQDTGIVCGNSSASLTGESVAGLSIRGTDSIKTVGCKSP